MDFIKQLPALSKFTAILVIIDHFTKRAIFVPTTDKVTSQDLTHLFVLHVSPSMGFPRMSLLTGVLSLCHTSGIPWGLEMKLHFTSGYHPEGDAQTEHANQTLEQYLWIYCNYQQSNWASLLPIAEFVYNNAPSATKIAAV
jgi:hypothetical protein